MDIKEFFRKAFSGYLWGNCLGMLVAVALLLLGSVWFLDRYTHHGETVRVPNVVGKNVRVVESQFNAVGLELEVVDTGYIKTLPADIILLQMVKPGSIVKPGRIVQVTVNSDHAMAVALPELADNSSYRDAESKLRLMGFRLTAPKYTAGDRDWVYGIEAAGKPLRAGQRVSVDVPLTLVVGDGKVYEEYNGNDSLDFAINGDMYGGSDDVDEGVQ